MSLLQKVKAGAQQAAVKTRDEVQELQTKREFNQTYAGLGRKVFELAKRGNDLPRRDWRPRRACAHSDGSARGRKDRVGGGERLSQRHGASTVSESAPSVLRNGALPAERLRTARLPRSCRFVRGLNYFSARRRAGVGPGPKRQPGGRRSGGDRRGAAIAPPL